MRRILILGPSGSGKTTLAERIGSILEIPVVHLDRHYWNPGWRETPEIEWVEKVRKLISQDSWVMDGNYTTTLAMRATVADTIIFIKTSRRVSYLRAFRRIFRYYGRNRPDLPEGCPEHIDLEFLKYIWNYPRTRQPVILRFLKGLQSVKEIHVLNSQTDIDGFLASLNVTQTSTSPT